MKSQWLGQSKAVKWGAVVLLAPWTCTYYFFRTDPLSYLLYPIAQQASFPIYGEDDFGLSRTPHDLAFSRDGESIFISRRSDSSEGVGTADMLSWSIKDESVDWTYDPDSNSPYLDSYALSEDRDWIVVPSVRGAVQIRDGQTGAVRTVLQGEDAVAIRGSVLSPDGSIIAGVETKQGIERSHVKLWDAETGKVRQSLDSYSQSPYMSFSPSGKRLAIAQDDFLDIWDIETETKLSTHRIGAEGSSIAGVHFTDDDFVTLEKEQCAIEQVAVATGEKIRSLAARPSSSSGHQSVVTPVSPDGKTLVCYLYEHRDRIQGDRTSGYALEIVDVAKAQRTGLIEDVGYIDEFAFSPDSQSLARADREGNLTIHTIKDGRLTGFAKVEHYGREVGYHPDGQAVIGINREGKTALLDVQTGKVTRTIVEAQSPFAQSIGGNPSLSRDGRTLITGSNAALRIFDNRSGTPDLVHTLPLFTAGRLGPTGNVTLSPSGRYFAEFHATGTKPLEKNDSLYESTIIVGETEPGEINYIVKGDSLIHDLVFSADGERFATIQRDRTAQIWNTRTGQKLQQIKFPPRTNPFNKVEAKSNIGRIAFSRDGKQLVTSDEYAIHVWNADTGAQQHTLMTNHGAGLTEWLLLDGDFAISPDGRWIAASRPPTMPLSRRDNRIYLWNARTGRLVRTLIPHALDPRKSGKIRSLTFSPDGKMLAAGDDENRLTLWTLPNRLSLLN